MHCEYLKYETFQVPTVHFTYHMLFQLLFAVSFIAGME